jgi:hypothetical protein
MTFGNIWAAFMVFAVITVILAVISSTTIYSDKDIKAAPEPFPDA